MRPESVLIVGASPLASRLVAEAAAMPHARLTILGVVDDVVAAEDPACGPRHLGPLKALERIVRERRPDRIIVTMQARRGRLPVDALLAARARGVVVEDGVDAYERLTGKIAIEALTPSALIFSHDFRKSPFDLAASRGISLLAAAAGLVLLAPLFLLIALAIRLDSRGPVFFVQERIGALGRWFGLIKFRTMRPAEEHHSEWAADNGDRITRVGRWLRKFRLDELPQLLNVLQGDMNLVGPRPHPVCNSGLFLERIPYYEIRLAVRPGITGWAQIRYGYANNLEEETEKMRYDLFYVKHLSLWLDLRILFDTVSVVLRGRGATSVIAPVTAAGAGGGWHESAIPA